MSGDYEVGYKKPPIRTQFKKGNQAAKRRKPRSDKLTGLSMPEILAKVLSAKRKAKRGEQIIELPVAEFIGERLIQTIMTGTARDLKIVIDLIQQYAPDALAAPMQEFAVRYHRAEGSTVPLPPLELWQARPSHDD